MSSAIGELIGQIGKALSDSNYSSIDPILSILRADTIEIAMSILQADLSKFVTVNFHPLAARITHIIAFLAKSKGDAETFVRNALLCISPNYSRYLPKQVQIMFINELNNTGPVSTEITALSQSPIDISLGFLNAYTAPSEDIPIVFASKSSIPNTFKVNSISLIVQHSQLGEMKVEILKDVELSHSTKLKHNQLLEIHQPGVIELKGAVLRMGNVELLVKAFREAGYIKSSILPFDSECQFSMTRPNFGIVNVPYRIGLNCEGIPGGADSFDYSLEIQSSHDFASFVGTHSESVPSPPAQITRDLEILATKNCEVNVGVSWSLMYQTVNSVHKDSFNVKFMEPFTVAFKIFDPDRLPVSLKKAPLLLQDEQYILVTTFEYNLPVTATILEINTVLSEGINPRIVPFELPLGVANREAFTCACFFTATNELNGPLGTYELRYSVNGSEMAYSVRMPSVAVPPKKISVVCHEPQSIVVKQQCEMLLDIRCSLEEGIEGELVIADSTNYQVKGDTKRMLKLSSDGQVQMPVMFTPMKQGKLDFPKISITGIDGTVLWRSVYTFVVQTEESE